MLNSEETKNYECYFIKNFRIVCNQVIEDFIPNNKKENIKVQLLTQDFHKSAGQTN
jgi:hypothetical protein